MTSPMWQGCLADTDYLEVPSAAGHCYGVWVTTPPGYDTTQGDVPVIYVLDGNFAVGQTAPLIVTQLDPMEPLRPYIQVSVGYAGDEAQHWARLRNRDLVPPGEPVAQELVDAVESAIDRGSMTREAVDAYLAELRDTRADVFLSFLTDELHPRIARDYGTATSGHGLFGYSYGGLFSLYAWLTGTPLFDTVGAGSPGLASEDSQVFSLLEQPGDAPRSARLHVTLNEKELLGPLAVYQAISQHTLTVLSRLSARNEPVSSAVMQETHVTGLQASFLSYLRTCHAV